MLQEFSQEVEETARSIVNEIHTALPGEIISFDAESGMAVVQPVGDYVTSDGTQLAYPSIIEVPVMFPYCQSVGVGMAFPVGKGDSCLIVISEVELDKWRSGAESEASLRFDLTSAIALPGLLRGSNDLITKAVQKNAVVLGTSETEVVISDDAVTVGVRGSTLTVSDSGIAIKGDLNVTGNISYTGSLTSG